jgi:ribosomal protein L14
MMSRKNSLSKEAWARIKGLKIVPTEIKRGITHKSVSVRGDGKFVIVRAPRHISHRKGERVKFSNHDRVIAYRKTL